MKGKLRLGRGGQGSWEGRVPLLVPLPLYTSRQAYGPQHCPCLPLPGLSPEGEVTPGACSEATLLSRQTGEDDTETQRGQG